MNVSEVLESGSKNINLEEFDGYFDAYAMIEYDDDHNEESSAFNTEYELLNMHKCTGEDFDKYMRSDFW